MTDEPDTAAPSTSPDPRPLMARAIDTATPVIEGVRPDQMTDPTPCDEMDVRRLLGHLVMVAQRVVAAGRGQHPSTWPGELEGLADDEWAGAWHDGAGSVPAAWAADAKLTRPTDLPWATMPGADALAIYINELTVHTWDLATATGQQVAWDVDVLAASLAAIRQQLPDQGRAEMWEAFAAELPPEVPWEVPFAPAVGVPSDASLIDRLVAWNGPRPTVPA